jgi:hypothetical protein
MIIDLPKILITYPFQLLLGDNVITETLRKLDKTSQRKARQQPNRVADVDMGNETKRYWYQH